MINFTYTGTCINNLTEKKNLKNCKTSMYVNFTAI